MPEKVITHTTVMLHLPEKVITHTIVMLHLPEKVITHTIVNATFNKTPQRNSLPDRILPHIMAMHR